MTPQQAEKVGALKRELAELRAAASDVLVRVEQLGRNIESLVVDPCPHIRAKDITLMGAEERTKYCKDCDKTWTEPFETAKGA